MAGTGVTLCYVSVPLAERVGEHVRDGEGEPGYHVLTAQRIAAAERGGRRDAPIPPNVDALVPGPDDPDQPDAAPQVERCLCCQFVCALG